MTDAIAIKTQGLTRRFGELTAVDRLDLEVPRGIVFGFLGPNGSGKTTTIRLMLGLLEATVGNAQVLGFDTQRSSAEIRQRTGALLEHTGLYERLTAEDNLEFFGRAWRLPAAKCSERIHSLLADLGLWERRKELVSTWSRGMKQKLAVARALLHEPELIFLDEPTAGLDPVAGAALREDLANLAARQGVTVFLTTHNLTEAEHLCGQVAVIRQGRLLKVGSPEDLRKNNAAPQLEIVGRGFNVQMLTALRHRPEVRAVVQENEHLILDLNAEGEQAPDTAPLVQFLVGQGAMIDEIRKGKASLEDVFLTLMEEDSHD